MRGIIDRLEGEYAVVLVGSDEVKLELPKILLPEGSREGDWLEVIIELDPGGTKKQEEKITGLLDKLKNKSKS